MPENQPCNNAVSNDILAMKLRAKLETDRELAFFLDKRPATIAQWRRRGAIPENALVRFEIRMGSK